MWSIKRQQFLPVKTGDILGSNVIIVTSTIMQSLTISLRLVNISFNALGFFFTGKFFEPRFNVTIRQETLLLLSVTVRNTSHTIGAKRALL